MTELLKQLQQYPKTWEKFVKFMSKKNYKEYHNDFDLFASHNDLMDYEATATFEKLLTSFCDGEKWNLAVLPSVTHQGKWYFRIAYLGEWTVLDEYRYFPSRQEAFEQGVKKAFELLEAK